MSSNNPFPSPWSRKAEPTAPALPRRMIRLAEVEFMIGLKRSQIFRLEAAGEFPRRRALGPRSVAWLESEVFAWIEARPTKELAGGPKEAA